MAAVAERHDALIGQFEAFRPHSAFGAGSWRDRREAAFNRFLDRGFPTSRDEEWKFTNVAPIAATAFVRAAPLVVSRSSIEPWLFDGAGPQVVLLNGRLAPALSSLSALPAGVSVRRHQGVELLPAGLDAIVERSLRRTAGPFVDLNAAFFEEIVCLDVAPKTVVTEPIFVLSLSASVDTPAMASPRVVVAIGEQAQVSIVERHQSLGPSATLANTVVEIEVGSGAVVDHVKLQAEAATAFHLASTFVRLGRAATFTSYALSFGGRIARNDVVATLDGDGAECTLDGLYVVDGDALVDTHTTIDHAKPHCPSHELYKGILAGRARAVFNGKIIVRPDAQKTDAKQTNKALLLTDTAQVNTKPQLEIFADDVKCTHGAAIGQIDEDALFYLRARGIGVLEARNLLIHAFAGEVLDGIKVPDVRATAMRLMEEKLRL
jgi:Fe-S cluster assembly protein SufD